MAEVEIAQLRERVAQLEKELGALKSHVSTKREKIDLMSAEVVDSNPYRYCAT